ncbi:hypothetical protein [Paenibacillus hamazuiensis]|uniref:hypothetical protein n=1 Tax=Paenibacillus hamazuiensis TaxID=2936508 RepID=UPI00200DFA54|nr:hypothetical protein [Paenibacillus hamazuiensis]
MRDKSMDRWNTYEPFYVHCNGMKIADIVITDHAQSRWAERVDDQQQSIEHICSFLWDRLKKEQIQPYYSRAKDVYLIDEDLVMVAEFFEINGETDIAGNPLHKMVVITFLGKLSVDIELRDLKTYYSWLRHSRRMTLMKHGRKRK